MADEPRTYNLIVIGGGPAGINGATTARVLGKSVALIDRHHELGGAGANTGTVPSKTLRETAVALSGLRSRDLYGVDLSLRREVTVGDFLRHERKVKSGLNAMLAQRLDACDADVFYGEASFQDPRTIRVRTIDRTQAKDEHKKHVASSEDEVLLHGEKILIATGSSPVRPSTFPFGPGIYDSDTLLELENVPGTMAVIGAGTIGSEYACTFATLGTKVHIIDGRDVLMSFLDGEISRALVKEMERLGIVFHWKERAETCTRGETTYPGGPGPIHLKLSSGLILTVDEVLVAAGRASATGRLNLPAAGVQLGDRGLIPVDDQFRTNISHIYAAGDVIGFPALASTSMDQARRAVRFAFGLTNDAVRTELMPHGIWTIPEIGMVGDTEESLKRKGIEYVVGRASYAHNARGRIIGDTRGFLKLLFRLSDLEMVGAHVIGEQATDVVHIGMMAMLARARADLFDELCFNLPTLGELYRFAAFDALRAAGRLSEVTQANEFL
ncbi:MAG: FAD-dependent oxidoreductase [Isosphaeraceae bacterium]